MSAYSRIIGNLARDSKGKKLGTITNVYKEGHKLLCVFDADFEMPVVRLEEIIDLINGPNESHIRVYPE